MAFYEDFTLASCVNDDIELGNVYQITIDKISSQPSPFDLLVSETIKSIIIAFFESVQNALIYICDDNDKKALQRFSTFDRWYTKSTMNKNITKINNIIEFSLDKENIKLYTFLMFHKENSNSKNIEEAFNNINNALNGEKP